MRFAALFFGVISVIMTAAPVRAAEHQARNAFSVHVEAVTGLPSPAAAEVQNRLQFFLESLESRLQLFVADAPVRDKTRRIDPTIEEFFTGRDATVQVSSLTSGITRDQEVFEYLNHLAQLRGRYTDIHLYFLKFELGPLVRVPDRRQTFETTVTVWQVFRGWRGDGVVYEDQTRKDLRVQMTVGRNNDIRFAIKEISVAETTKLDVSFRLPH